MEKVLSEVKVNKLKSACRTKWVERINSYIVFLGLLLAVHHTLSAMVKPNELPELRTNWAWDGETIKKGNGFLHQLQSSSFLICFKVLLEVMCCMRGLTKKLQSQAIDVFYVYKQVNSVVSTLKGMRDNSDREFHKIFEEATKLGKTLMETTIFSVCHVSLDVNPIAAILVSQAQKTTIGSHSTMSFCLK